MKGERTNPATRPPGGPVQNGLTAQLKKRYSNTGRGFTLDITFTVAPGITIVFGPSGAGKTTLLDCIAGLTIPESGRIKVGDRVLFDHETNLPTHSRKIGYVFQDLALFSHLTIRKNVEYGLSGSDRRQRADTILESFRIAHLRD